MTKASNGNMTSLLDLPPEIRLYILRHLLVLSKPVQTRYKVEWIKQPSGIPPINKPIWSTWLAQERPTGQILSTCTQLFNEGIDMLYNENTFAITVIGKAKLEPSQAADFLGYHSLQQAFYRYPRLKQVCKWVFDVNIDPAFKGIGVEGFSWRIDRLVREMRDLCPHRLQIVNVKVVNGNDESVLMTRDHRGMFQELGLLRSDSASISGVCTGFAPKLTNLIMSHKPVVDIKKLFEAYVPSIQQWDWTSQMAAVQYELFMVYAMLEWDIELLWKLNTSVAAMFDAPHTTDLIRRVMKFGLWPEGVIPVMFDNDIPYIMI